MSKDIRLDVAELERAISNLLVQFPELQDDEAWRADTFEGSTNLHEVLAEIVNREREAKAMAAATKARMDDLSTRKARFERQQEAWRHLIQHLMERADLRKMALPEATLSVAFRKGTPQVTDPDALPDECVQLVRKPVMDIIKAWTEAGNTPEGVALGNGKTSLTIRSR